MPENTDLVSKISLLATRTGAVCNSLRNEISTGLANAKLEVKNEILGGAGEAYDTLKEIQDILSSDQAVPDALNALKNVSYELTQTLTDSQKGTARTNINAADASDVVKLSSQTLDSTVQATARTNIGAADASDVVKLSSQTLDSTVQATARANIDAASATDLTTLTTNLGSLSGLDFVSTFNANYEPTVNAPTISSSPSTPTTTDVITLTGNAFSMVGLTGTHEKTDWKICTTDSNSATGEWDSLNDTTNKTSITISAGTLTAGTYYAFARYYDSIHSVWSAWSGSEEIIVTNNE